MVLFLFRRIVVLWRVYCSGRHVFVDLEDDVVVVGVLRGGGEDLHILRWKSRAGGDDPGYVVVEFGVHNKIRLKVKG